MLTAQQTRQVFLQHDVEIGAAKTKRTDPRPAHVPAADIPWSGFHVHVKRHMREINVRVGTLKIGAGRQGLLLERQDGLQQTGCPGSTLQVTNVGFDRAQRNAPCAHAQAAKNSVQAIHLGHIPHSGGGAVTFDQANALRRDAGIFPGAFQRPLLPDRVGGGDALALSITAAANAAHHGIDFISVTLGIFQPFRQEDYRPLALNKAIGPVGIRP